MKRVNLTAMQTESWEAILPARWRAMRSAPASGVTNMAIDATLLEAAAHREFGVWRTYAWDQPTVSFGRNEAVRGRVDPATLADAGLQAVRRPTGGRALLHAAEVTYSVTLPIGDGIPWHAAYGAVNEVLIAALRALGVAAELAGPLQQPPLRPDGPVCFAQPAPGEIVVAGAKLVGSAVWRERGAYLQHGSILLEDHQQRLSAALVGRPSVDEGPSAAAPDEGPSAAALTQCCPTAPTWEHVADALEAALRAVLLTRHEGVLSSESVPLDADVLHRHETRYRDAQWLWRR